MYMGGLLPRRLDAETLPGTAALATAAAAERTAALAAFAVAGTAVDVRRSDTVARTALYASLWRDAEDNGDAYLSAEELASLTRDLATRVASRAGYGAHFFTGRPFATALASAMRGDMLTYDELVAALEALFTARNP
jgi:hypothetical protein